MRIDRVAIDNFLSFRDFEWPDIDPHLNLVVGPNDAGKTNFFNAFRMVVDVLAYERRFWEHAAHRGSTTTGFKVSLDIEFTGEWEQELLRTYVGAVLSEEVEDAMQARLSGFILHHFTAQDVKPILAGRLVVSYDGVGGWTAHYQSRANEPFFCLNLFDSVLSFKTGGHHKTGSPHGQGSSLMDAWKKVVLVEEGAALLAFLDGKADTLPVPDLSRVFSQPPEWVKLQVHRTQQNRLLPTHREFDRRMGLVATSQRDYYEAQAVFHRLLQHQVVFTDNVRKVPERHFLTSEFQTNAVDLSNGERLALYLFMKKNGASSDRTEYGNIQTMFGKLLSAPEPRVFDVGLGGQDARVPQAPTPEAAHEEKSLDLELRTTSKKGDIPIDFSGAGVTEALFLSAVVIGGENCVVLLDEPALNLHPGVQRQLIWELQTQVDKQFFVVTHSASLVPADAITMVSRFYLNADSTARAVLPAVPANEQVSDVEKDRLSKLQQELRRSTDSVALLFSNGVILCEGQTELGALPVWQLSLEDGNIVVFSVDGDPNFETYLRLLRAFAVPWAIVCDGKVIARDGERQKNIAEQMKAAGIEKSPSLEGLDFHKRCEALREFGVFTAVEAEPHEFEDVPGVRAHKTEAKREFPNSKVRQGRYIAQNYPCPPEVSQMLSSVVTHLKSQIGSGG